MLLAGITVVVVAVGYVIFNPSDGLPASIKFAKIQYIGFEMVREIFGIEGDSFKKESEDSEPGETYRLLHRDSWVELGLEEEDINTALAHMQQSEKSRYSDEYDTVTEYGPGNWIYEFETYGDQYFQQAEEYEAKGENDAAKTYYIKSSMYYKVAAFPGVTRSWNPNHKEVIHVYQKSLHAYEKYSQYLAHPAEKVTVTIDGKEVFGYLHLPQLEEHEKAPLVILTNGTDFFLTELYLFVEKITASNLGVFVFDVPGIGASHEITLKPGDQAPELHRTFLKTLANDSRIDAQKIGFIGKSLGGNIASKLAFTESKHEVKFIVNYCGPIDKVAGVPLDVLKENFPAMTFDALFARFYDTSEKNDDLMVSGIQELGLIHSEIIKEGTKTEIPILSVNTASDPANPVWEMKLLTKLSQGGDMMITEGEGHCPPDEQPQEVIDWINKQL
jgi:esterase FrsA